LDSKLFGGLIAVLAVAAVSLLLRRFQSGGGPATTMPSPPGDDRVALEESGDLDDEPDEDDSEQSSELLAIESDGHVWLPDRHGIHRFPLAAPDSPDSPVEPALLGGSGTVNREEFEAWRAKQSASRQRGLPGEGLHAGDFTAARVVRGAPDIDPWRLEALSRDGAYVPFAFETEEAARVALAMLERFAVVRRPPGDDDDVIPAARGDFEEARLRWERTIEELAMAPEAEPEEPS
jgi:hypothetical protein